MGNLKKRQLNYAKPNLKMESDEDIEIAEKLKSRGLTCKSLKLKIDQKLKEAKEFRGYGFLNIAQAEEDIARKLKGLQEHVCKLK